MATINFLSCHIRPQYSHSASSLWHFSIIFYIPKKKKICLLTIILTSCSLIINSDRDKLMSRKLTRMTKFIADNVIQERRSERNKVVNVCTLKTIHKPAVHKKKSSRAIKFARGKAFSVLQPKINCFILWESEKIGFILDC